MLKVLMVEDSADDADLTLRELRKNGRRVEAKRVESADALAAAMDAGPWDIVISDYRLPRMLGNDVARLVRARDAEVPLIFVSGTIGEELAVELLKAGADDYVMKGSLTRLASSVDRALRARAEREARQRSEEALRESEARFRQLAENIDTFFFLTDPRNTEIYYASPAYEKIFGRTLDSLYADARSWREAVHREDLPSIHERWKAALAAPSEVRYRVLRPDGIVRWIKSRAFPIRDGKGNVYRMAGIIEDETEQRRAGERIRRLNRVYAVLSSINSLIVRASRREELFQEACRIAVEEGRFRMAWLGVYDGVSKAIVPAAHYGHEDGFLQLISLALSDPVQEGRGLVRRAVRDKRPVVINDVAGDTEFRLRDEALRRDYRSAAVLPLLGGEDVTGVFGLFADEPEIFDDEEIRLLLELAGDISFALQHIEKSEKLDYLAYYDALTGLANRTLFLERLNQHMHAAREQEARFSLVVSDLERFRAVNDSLGRAAGDRLLAHFAERLLGSVPEGSLVSRLGADQFAILLPEARNEFEAARLLDGLAKACLAEPFWIDENELRLSARAGVALFPDDGTEAETLLHNAEAAVKASKRSGERRMFFESSMTERVAEKLSLESRLRRAIEREEFVLHYQPRVGVENREIRGVEALIRWQTGEGLVPPLKFIPLLEETGMILEVGAWALRRAVLDQRAWREAGLKAPRVAVNISAVQLRQRDFPARVKRAVELGASAAAIDLEITESMIMGDIGDSIAKLAAVRELGLGVALDDFGTGYSSLAYLAKLPVDALKIDRSFIITMLKDPNAMTLVSTIISLGHSLKLKVVAEGVDAEEQARTLHLLRCDEFQGYLYSKPLPGAELMQLLRRSDSR